MISHINPTLISAMRKNDVCVYVWVICMPRFQTWARLQRSETEQPRRDSDKGRGTGKQMRTHTHTHTHTYFNSYLFTKAFSLESFSHDTIYLYAPTNISSPQRHHQALQDVQYFHMLQFAALSFLPLVLFHGPPPPFQWH